jgi:pyrroline-5-carboxylate reductase
MIEIRKIAFVGAGNMAAALIGGLISRGLARERIVVSDPNKTQCDKLSVDYGVAIAPDNAAAAKDADLLVLAVKPQQMRTVATTLAPQLGDVPPLILSVAAGITHASLAAWFGATVAIVRTMPNRPALLGCGATALYAPTSVGAAERASAEAVMRAVGTTVWVDQESQMDTVTALSGSGPAYFFLFMEALEAGARARGLPADVAHALTLQTALGAAQMAATSSDSLQELRTQVTSKGGTTAAALAVFDAADLRGIVAHALAAADQRSAELAAEFGGA